MSSFFHNVVIIVIHTPLWVWPLYVLLLFLGFQRTRDSSVALWRVLTLPLVVTLLAALNFIGVGLGAVPFILLGAVIGGTTGWRLERDGGTSRLPDGRIWLRGEWLSFSLIVIVLIYRYAIKVVPVFYPALYADTRWIYGTLFVATTLSAVFLGRTAARLRVYFAAAPVLS